MNEATPFVYWAYYDHKLALQASDKWIRHKNLNIIRKIKKQTVELKKLIKTACTECNTRLIT